jgi:acetylglutamate kinase
VSRQADTIVVKLGGSTLGDHDTSLADCAALHRDGRRLVIVHGGGAAVSDWLDRQSIAAEWVDGLRITTAASREVVIAVLGGLVNKTLVQQLNALGARAVGISGADAMLLTSPASDRGLGYVGESPEADPTLLASLLDDAFLPVVAPLGLTPDGSELLNINADAAAGAIAAAIGASQIVFLTDVPGILDGDGNLAAQLTPAESDRLRTDGVIQGGMLPKLAACERAAAAGVTALIIDGRQCCAIRAAIEGRAGTLVSDGRGAGVH